ncbi:MAG TPA: PIN domain-containing protein [Thermaerobacter sp.]
MTRWIVDANVLIYIIDGRNEQFAPRARAALQHAQSQNITLYIPVAVLAEVVYVLLENEQFQYPRDQVADALLELVQTPGIECQDKEAVIWALKRFREKDIDFVDAYCAGLAMDSGDPVLTNDRDIIKLGRQFDVPVRSI